MNPPLDFLLVCSEKSLQDFELSRLNRLANLRKQVHTIEDELRQAEAEAMLARWFMDYRDRLLAAGAADIAQTDPIQHSFEFAPPKSVLGPGPKRKAMTA